VETEHFGNFLRQRREARGLSIAELSRATRIKETNLELLEDGRFDAFPAEVFVVGFVKAYAREVGLDPGDALQRYRVERGDTSDEIVIEPALVELHEEAPLHGRRFGVALVVFLILIVATLTISLLLRHGPPPGAMSGGSPSRSASDVSASAVA
jgi:cytoskeleton protein RodZ